MQNPCHSLVVYRGASLIFTNMLVVIISDIALYDSRCGNAGSRLRRDKRGDWMKNEGGKGSDGRACSIMSHSTRIDQLLDPPPPPAAVRGRDSCAATAPFCDTVTYAPPTS